jgi:hypothetical protein
MMILYAVAIFLSAFLLFQVQPLIAKIILPWFGGSAAVWSAAMVFFQLVLLAGYGYAHILIRHLRARSQTAVHIALLAISCALLPILPSTTWQPSEAGDPTLRILALLAATIGLPYFLLASTTPLLQAWYVRRSGSGMPYRLFALSNFGSLLALISFPFVVEPKLTSHQQAYTWSALYVLFAVWCGYAAWISATSAADSATADPVRESAPLESPTTTGAGTRELRDSGGPSVAQMGLWVALSACASTLLVSVTNHLSQNVAPIPLLWVVPLSLYLATFILAFESDRIYQRWIFVPLLAPALGGMAYMIWAASGNLHIRRLIPGFAIGLFICCMLCNGELARRRPAPPFLTLFYLMISLGGAAGGIFVAVIAPRIFSTYLELQVGLVACAALAAIVLWDASIPKIGAWALRAGLVIGAVMLARPAWFHLPFDVHRDLLIYAILVFALLWSATIPKLGEWPLRAVLVVAAGVLTGYLARSEHDERKGYRVSERNFYGELRVKDDAAVHFPTERLLFHGTIKHGSQVLDDRFRYKPISYYGPNSGVGRAILALEEKGAIRVGVIGLGAGVLNAYARPGDMYRIYEINPLVEQIAQTEFDYFAHSPADKSILLGDARLTLEGEASQQFDVLAVDAFSSDAIPIHLLTREALATYFRHLTPSGILAVHISNRYLDLAPVCALGARDFEKIATIVADDGDENDFELPSTWVLLTSNLAWFQSHSFDNADLSTAVAPSRFREWTDNYSNVFQFLKLQ